MDRVIDILKQIVQEAGRFDSQYDRRIRDLALEALATAAATLATTGVSKDQEA